MVCGLARWSMSQICPGVNPQEPLELSQEPESRAHISIQCPGLSEVSFWGLVSKLCSQSQQFLSQISNSALVTPKLGELEEDKKHICKGRITSSPNEIHVSSVVLGKLTVAMQEGGFFSVLLFCVSTLMKGSLSPRNFRVIFCRELVWRLLCCEVNTVHPMPAYSSCQQPLRPDVLSVFWMRMCLVDPFPCPVLCPLISEDAFWWETLSLLYSDGFEFYEH